MGALRGQKRGLNPLKLELQEPSVGAGNRTLALCESDGTSCRLSCGSQHLYVLSASVCHLVHLLDNGHRLLVLWGGGVSETTFRSQFSLDVEIHVSGSGTFATEPCHWLLYGSFLPIAALPPHYLGGGVGDGGWGRCLSASVVNERSPQVICARTKTWKTLEVPYSTP